MKKKLQDLYVEYVWPATRWLDNPNRHYDDRPLKDIVRLLKWLRTQGASLLGPWETELYLNGVLQRQGLGSDYTISGNTITWLESSGKVFDFHTGDVIAAKYGTEEG